MADKFPSTLLVSLADKLAKLGDDPSRRDVETEIRKADLDLLDKLNQLAQQIASLPTTASIPTVTKEVAFTPTFTGFGTVTVSEFSWTRVGNRLKVMGHFTAGTTTGVEARISLPNSLVSDSSLITNVKVIGTAIRSPIDVNGYLGVLVGSGTGYVTFTRADQTNFGTMLGNAIISAGQSMILFFELPISGWNS